MHRCSCKHECISKDHQIPTLGPLSGETAQEVARLMGALATPSRVRVLSHLRASECAVGELAEAVGMEQPAVSHQLRILRDLGLVVGERRGRQVIYRLHDHHISSLIDEVLRHLYHRPPGSPDAVEAPELTRSSPEAHHKEQP
ncbi:hypothetical protein BH23ACT2_BH23ACT2_22760 [soil metagenome]